jgi:23S rRNA pseudouridine2604 synthase
MVIKLVWGLCLVCGGLGFSSFELPRRSFQTPSIIRSRRLAFLLFTNTNNNNNHEDCEPIRLNKVFKATHSRRQADELIASGRVTVNGEPVVDSAGRRVIPFRDVVCLDGKMVFGWEALNSCIPTNKDTNSTIAFEYIKYWKPCGVTCTTDRSIQDNIIDQLWHKDGYRPNHRVYPVGRLDKDTSGLILLTSDGRLPNSALRGRYKQSKTYEVLVNEALTNEEVQQLRDGVVITTQAQRDGKRAPPLTARTKPCLVETLGSNTRRLRMTLVEGRNRQIRKMIASLGLKVQRLHRSEFMGITLGPLRGPGDWTPLSTKELEIVRQVISSAQDESESSLDSW